MINYETILSMFDDKVTLMQWLKNVEDALKNASLQSVSVIQPTQDTAELTFVFADGTSVTSPRLNLPRGIQGPQGPQGIQGPQGATGATGATGPQGPQGVAGGSVNVMPSAEACTEVGEGYIDANGHLLVLTSLSPRTFTDVGVIRGPKGDKGDKGDTGDTGATGPQGPQGVEGPQGPQGVQGVQGLQGVGINTIALNSNNQFVITLTDSTIITTDPITLPAPQTLEQIKDANGRNRFIEGNIASENYSGVTLTYSKWSLSGTHIMFVIAGYIASGTIIADNPVGRASIPTWVAGKIATVWANFIETKAVTIRATDWSGQVLNTGLAKSGNDILIYFTGSDTLTKERFFRIQYDLLIDTN